MGASREPEVTPHEPRQAGAGQALTLSHRHLPGLSVVALAGYLDRTTSPLLADYLRRACRPGDHVVIDMEKLTFCDSSGLHVLVACARQCTDQQATLHLAAASGAPARLLDITGVGAYLPLHATVEQAIAGALTPGGGG